MRKILILIFLLAFLPSVYAYPNNEIPEILKEKYPNADFTKDIIIQNIDGILIISYSSLPIPDNNEMESLWLQVVAKRQIEAQNKIDETDNTNTVRNQYDQALVDLNTIKTTESPTNTQIVWAVKRMAEIEYNLLRWLRWFYT